MPTVSWWLPCRSALTLGELNEATARSWRPDANTADGLRRKKGGVPLANWRAKGIEVEREARLIHI